MSKKIKIYISADIEGTTGACLWDSGRKGTEEYCKQSQIMTKEVLAVVSAINNFYAECEIWIKDAHATGCNLDVTAFPENCIIIRGWDEGPLCMMQGLDESFSKVFLLGYHSEAGSDGSPLAHTLNSKRYSEIRLNGERMSEFLLNYGTSIMFGVPVVLVSGDEHLCNTIKNINPHIKTISSQIGYGGSVVNHGKIFRGFPTS